MADLTSRDVFHPLLFFIPGALLTGCCIILSFVTGDFRLHLDWRDFDMTGDLPRRFFLAGLWTGILLFYGSPARPQGSPIGAIDVTYYNIHIRLDTLQKKVSGRVDIQATRSGHSGGMVRLDLTDSATVDSILVNGRSARYIRHNGKLDVILDEHASHCGILDLLCYYAVPFSDSGVSMVYCNGIPVIQTYGLPYSAKEWWPCKDVPADKADSADIYIRVPRSLTAVSNGKLLGVTDSLSGDADEEQFHWKVTYPIYPDVISLAVSGYSQFTIDTAEIPFYFYVFKQDLEKAKKDFPVLTEMLRSHEHYFGAYPFKKEKYGIAEFARQSYREHQTIPSLGYNYITGEHTADRVLAHELAHQWFGNCLSVKNWKDVWLNEGFCNYAYALWMEFRGGKQQYEDVLKKYDRSDFNGPVLLRDSSDIDAMFTPTTFCKGAWVLHMLRNVMGDASFFKAIKEYVLVYRYKNVATKDFEKICEQWYRRPLQWFFDEWLLGTGRPFYTCTYKMIREHQKNFVLLSLLQRQMADIVYTMPVEIQFILKNGKVIQKKYWNSHRKQMYKVCLGNPIDKVIIDPDGKILKNPIPVSK